MFEDKGFGLESDFTNVSVTILNRPPIVNATADRHTAYVNEEINFTSVSSDRKSVV